MSSRILVCLFALVAAASLPAQTATLTAQARDLDPNGGSLTLAAAVTYAQPPAALGWSIPLPAGWTFVGIAGADQPTIGPVVGETGTLGFAYTKVPPAGTSFSFTVNYPAKAGAVSIVGEALLRIAGKESKVTATAVNLQTP